jgi:hypothetical protein
MFFAKAFVRQQTTFIWMCVGSRRGRITQQGGWIFQRRLSSWNIQDAGRTNHALSHNQKKKCMRSFEGANEWAALLFLGPRVRGNGGAVQRAAQETRLAVAHGQPDALDGEQHRPAAGVLWSMLRPEVPGNIAIYKCVCLPFRAVYLVSSLSQTLENGCFIAQLLRQYL